MKKLTKKQKDLFGNALMLVYSFLLISGLFCTYALLSNLLIRVVSERGELGLYLLMTSVAISILLTFTFSLNFMKKIERLDR